MPRAAKKTVAPELVAILWIPTHVDVDENGDCEIACLTGHGGMRTYERDNYDGRVDLGRDREKDGPIPFFEKFSEAMDYMKAHKGESVQVPAYIARQIF